MSMPCDGYHEQNRPRSKSHRRLSRASGIDGYRHGSISTVCDNYQHLVLWIPARSYGNPQASRPLEIERDRCAPRGIHRCACHVPAIGTQIDTQQGPSVGKTVNVDRQRCLPRATSTPEQKLGMPAQNQRISGLSTAFDIDIEPCR